MVGKLLTPSSESCRMLIWVDHVLEQEFLQPLWRVVEIIPTVLGNQGQCQPLLLGSLFSVWVQF